MSDTLLFKVFCFEAYRAEKHLTGIETIILFKKYNVLSYLETCYDVYIQQVDYIFLMI